MKLILPYPDKNLNPNRPWTDDEIDYLRDNYKTKSHEQIGVEINRTRNAVRSRCSLLGIVDVSDNWTDADINILKYVYENNDYADDLNLSLLAKELGKLKSNVCRKAKELGLTNKNRSKKEFKNVKQRKFNSDVERSAHMSLKIKEWMSNNEHPRGFLGKKHNKESLEKISKASINNWRRFTAEQIENKILKCAKTKEVNGTMQNMNRANSSWGAAWREIGGIRKYYRTKWEANYARYLEWLRVKGEIKEWKHEPETFWFEGIKRGCLSYLPDFRVIENNGAITYHEVKGWMDDRSKTKIKRMAKYHPLVKLIVIDAKAYAALKKTIQPFIKDWETDAKGR